MGKDDLRHKLNACGAFENLDAAQKQVVEFACSMHNRIVEKQADLSDEEYDGDNAVESWNNNDEAAVQLLLHDIGKNVCEAAHYISEASVTMTSLIDVANLAMIVDGWARETYQR